MSKVKTILIVSICAFALIMAGGTFAQLDTEVHEFSDGTTAEYAAGWVIDDFGTYIILTNTQDVMDLYASDSTVEPGGVVVLLASPEALSDLELDSDGAPTDVVAVIMEQTGLDGEIQEGNLDGFATAYAEVANRESRAAGITAAIVALETPTGTCFLVIQTGDAIDDYQDELTAIIGSLVGGSSAQPTATSRSGGNPPPRGGATPTATPSGGSNPPPRGGSSTSDADASIDGELDNRTSSAYYVVSLSEGDVITLELAAENNGFDTLVRLYAPGDLEGSGNAAVFNDDSGDAELGPLNSRIAEFEVTESGDWVIEATSFSGTATGEFTLSIFGEEDYRLELLDGGAVEVPEPAGIQAIRYNDTVEGELTTRQPEQLWQFEGSEGDVVTITMLSEEDAGVLDTRLYLFAAESYSSNDDPVADNDDSGDDEIGALNARIEAFELPESGDYIIVATSFASAGTGVYTLSLTTGDEPPVQPTATTRSSNPPPRSATATPEPRTGGTTINDEFTDDVTTRQYGISLNEGDVITIELVADNDGFDPFLNLYAPGEFETGNPATAFNDDSSDTDLGRLNSRIEAFEVSESGDWVIETTSYIGTATGSYTLTVYGDEAEYTIEPLGDEPVTTLEPTLEPTSGDLIAYNEPVIGEFGEESPFQVFRFAGTAGDVVTITMVATDDKVLDPLVRLYTAADYDAGAGIPAWLIENDDSEDADLGRFNSRVDAFELPESGDYVLVATSFNGSSWGEFTLTVSTDAAAPQPTDVPVSGELRQWATSASATSQYGEDSWSASQATGEPDSIDCADQITAWASESSRGRDTLTVEYDVAVIPSQVNIYQNYNPGAIVEVRLVTEDGEEIILPDSEDPIDNTPCPGVFTVDISGVDSPVVAVAVDINQKLTGSWNEIDAVELVGELP